MGRLLHRDKCQRTFEGWICSHSNGAETEILNRINSQFNECVESDWKLTNVWMAWRKLLSLLKEKLYPDGTFLTAWFLELLYIFLSSGLDFFFVFSFFISSDFATSHLFHCPRRKFCHKKGSQSDAAHNPGLWWLSIPKVTRNFHGCSLLTSRPSGAISQIKENPQFNFYGFIL